MTGGVSSIQDVQVRIGELASTADASQRLITVGLGSCVGVVIIDERAGVRALAHVFLPEPPESGPKPDSGPAMYAVYAVPELLRQVRALGGGPASRLVAVIAGGARMFAGARSSTADIGERNVAAVTQALREVGVRIEATRTGGTHGRTIRVEPGRGGRVTVREVGRSEEDVWCAQEAVAPVVNHAAAA